jgi:hypothetical protein
MNIEVKTEDYMRKKAELPSLDKAGIGKKFRIFIEIARRTNGITISDVTQIFSKDDPGSKKFSYDKQGIWHHIGNLRDIGYVITEYEKRNGKVSLVCKATPLGVDMVFDEMCRLCQVMHEIKDELKK